MAYRFYNWHWACVSIFSPLLLVQSIAPTPSRAHAPDEPLAGLAALSDGWVATNYGLLGQDSAGGTWQWTPEELLDHVIYVWSWSPATDGLQGGKDTIAVGTDDGVWVTTTSGCLWKRLAEGALAGLGIRDLQWQGPILFIAAEAADGIRGGLYRWDGVGVTKLTGADTEQVQRLAAFADGETLAFAAGIGFESGTVWLGTERISPPQEPVGQWKAALGRSSHGLVMLWDGGDGPALVRVTSDATLTGPRVDDAHVEGVPTAATWSEGLWWMRLETGQVYAHGQGGWVLKATDTTALGLWSGEDPERVYWGAATTREAGAVNIVFADGSDLAPFADIRPRNCSEFVGSDNAVAIVDLLWPVIKELGTVPQPTPAVPDAGGCTGADRTPGALLWLTVLMLFIGRRRGTRG